MSTKHLCRFGLILVLIAISTTFIWSYRAQIEEIVIANGDYLLALVEVNKKSH